MPDTDIKDYWIGARVRVVEGGQVRRGAPWLGAEGVVEEIVEGDCGPCVRVRLLKANSQILKYHERPQLTPASGYLEIIPGEGIDACFEKD